MALNAAALSTLAPPDGGGKKRKKSDDMTSDSGAARRHGGGGGGGGGGHADAPGSTDPVPVAGWIPLKQMKERDLDREASLTLAAMLPIGVPALCPRRVLVDTAAGLKEGHAAQEHVVRDFDSRFIKTSGGSPLFTSGLFLKPPTLPAEDDNSARRRRIAAETEDEYKARGLGQTAEAGAEETGDHLAMELAQFTFNKFDLSRKSQGDKGQEAESLRGVDPSRIHQLLAHNIRSTAPGALAEPVCCSESQRSNVQQCRKKPRPLPPKPPAVLPSSPLDNYLSVPGREDPVLPFSEHMLMAAPLDSNYLPLPYPELAKGNEGEKDTEAPLVLNPSPPEMHLHVPGKEQSYFSVPATPPTLSLAAPREAPQETVTRATHKDDDSRPRPLAVSTPPEAAFFVPHREIPAMPQTALPKTAGFGSFVATPVTEKLEQPKLQRHKPREGEDADAHPHMLLPRTPAEVTFDAPTTADTHDSVKQLAKKLGNNKAAKRPDMFSIPPTPPAPVLEQPILESRKGVELGPRAKPILPRTPAETKLALPRRDETGVQLPPSGQFFSVPATPPAMTIEASKAPVIVRSDRKKRQNAAEEEALRQQQEQGAEERKHVNSSSSSSSWKLTSSSLSPSRDEQQQQQQEQHSEQHALPPRKKLPPAGAVPIDLAADDMPKQILPATPPETKAILPPFVAPTGADRSKPGTFNAFTVFATPATPVTVPIQPDMLELREKHPQERDPLPVLPRTPMESALTVPVQGRAGTDHDVTLEDNTFSIPPTPPGQPLFAVPPPQRGHAAKSDPADGTTRQPLPPTPVEARLEALPPVPGIDMPAVGRSSSSLASTSNNNNNRSTSATATDNKMQQVFSVPATPPEQPLDHHGGVPVKTKIAEQDTFFGGKRNDGAKPLMPPTPPELTFANALPPGATFGKAQIVSSSSASPTPSGTHMSRSGSAATAASAKSAGGSSNRPPLAPAKHGQFFSVPATPPTSGLPTVKVVRKRGQGEGQEVVDTKPVIPSTPPEDFFSLPKDKQAVNASNARSPGKSSVVEGKFFSLGATPPGATAPLPPSASSSAGLVVEGHRRGASPDPPRARIPKEATPPELDWGIDAIPAHLRQSAPKAGYVPAPKRESEEDVAARELRELEEQQAKREVAAKLLRRNQEDNAVRKIQCLYRQRAAKKRVARLKAERKEREEEEAERAKAAQLERELRALEEQQKALEAGASGRELTPDEAARRIQCVQRQRKAKRELSRLKSERVDKERVEEEEKAATRRANLEATLKKLEDQQTQLESTARSEGRELTQDEAALRIQSMQRQRAARRELAQLKAGQAQSHREHAQATEKRERQITDDIRKVETELRVIEDRLNELSDKKKKKLKQQQQGEADDSTTPSLTPEETAEQQQLFESRKTLENELRRLDSDAKVAKEEREAYEAASVAAKLSQEVTQLRDRIKVEEQSVANLQQRAESENRPLSAQEQEVISRSLGEQAKLREQLSALEGREQSLKTEATAQFAQAEEARADDAVARLKSEVRELEDEAARIDAQARREGRSLTEDEAARKIQCRQRQRIAKMDLDKRKSAAAAKAVDVANAEKVASLQNELLLLYKQEAQYAEIERGGGDGQQQQQQPPRSLTSEEAANRAKAKARVDKVKAELIALKAEPIHVSATVSSPAAALDVPPPSQVVGGSGSLSSRRGGHHHQQQQSPRSPADVEGVRLPQTPPDRTHEVLPPPPPPAPGATHLSIFDSLPAEHPTTPRHSLVSRHSGGVSPHEVKPLLPPTPPATKAETIPTTSGEAHAAAAATSSFAFPATPPEDSPLQPPTAGHHHRGRGGGDGSSSSPTAPLPPTPTETNFTPATTALTTAVSEKNEIIRELRAATEQVERLSQQLAAAEHEVAQVQQRARFIDDRARREGNRRLTAQEAAEVAALTAQEADKQQVVQHLRSDMEDAEKTVVAKRAALDAAQKAEDVARLENEVADLARQDAAISAKERSGATLTPDEAARKIQCRQRQRMAKQRLQKLKGDRAMAESSAAAKAAEAEAAKAETDVEKLESEIEALAKQEAELRAKERSGVALTENEAARRIQCMQRQRMARRELDRRRGAAVSKKAEADAAAAQEQVQKQEQELRALEEQQRAIEEQARNEGRALTEDEAARRIQCMQRQRMARQEMDRRRQAAAAREAQAAAAREAQARAEAEAAAEVAAREDELRTAREAEELRNRQRGILEGRMASSEADRLAGETVRVAQEEADRRYPGFSSPTTGSGAPGRSESHDGRPSLPGLDARPSSRASSALVTDGGLTPDARPLPQQSQHQHYRDPHHSSHYPSRSSFSSSHHQQHQLPSHAAAPPSPSPVIIRRFGMTAPSLARSIQNVTAGAATSSSSSFHATDPLDESPTPLPLQPGTVVTSIAGAMPEAKTLAEFAQNLEVYFASFDPSQVPTISSIAPAYRNRQRELWGFLKQRYESGGAGTAARGGEGAMKTTTTTTVSSAMLPVLASPSAPPPTAADVDSSTMRTPTATRSSVVMPSPSPAPAAPSPSAGGRVVDRPVPVIIRRGGSGSSTPTSPPLQQQRTTTTTTTTSGTVATVPTATTSTVFAAGTTPVASTTTPRRLPGGLPPPSVSSPTATTPAPATPRGTRIGEQIVRSDTRQQTLVEDLALSEIMKMLGNKPYHPK